MTVKSSAMCKAIIQIAQYDGSQCQHHHHHHHHGAERSAVASRCCDLSPKRSVLCQLKSISHRYSRVPADLMDPCSERSTSSTPPAWCGNLHIYYNGPLRQSVDHIRPRMLTQIRWGGKWVHLTQYCCLGHLCAKKLSKLVEIWRSSDENNFDCFLRHGVFPETIESLAYIFAAACMGLS